MSALLSQVVPVDHPRRGFAGPMGIGWLLALFGLASCTASAPGPETPHTGETVSESPAPGGEALAVEGRRSLDLGEKPALRAELSIEHTNSAPRGQELATQLDRFADCVGRIPMRGSFSISGFIRPDGSITRLSVGTLDLPEPEYRCLRSAAEGLSWRPTGLASEVGFTARVQVNAGSRRDGTEVRGSFETRGDLGPTTGREPRMSWSSVRREGGDNAVRALEHWARSRLPDCVWHASPELPVADATVSVTLRRGADGSLSGFVFGPVDDAILSCLERLAPRLESIAPEPFDFRGDLIVGTAGLGAIQ